MCVCAGGAVVGGGPAAGVADGDFCGDACSGRGGAAALLAAALSSAALSAAALASATLLAAALASAVFSAVALASALSASAFASAALSAAALASAVCDLVMRLLVSGFFFARKISRSHGGGDSCEERGGCKEDGGRRGGDEVGDEGGDVVSDGAGGMTWRGAAGCVVLVVLRRRAVYGAWWQIAVNGRLLGEIIKLCFRP